MINERGNRFPVMERLWGWPALLIALWMLLLLYMPFVEQTWGKGAFHTSISLSVLIQSVIILFLMARAVGIQSMAIMAGKVVLLTWAFEAIGAATDFPFGSYRYTDLLQPQFIGVPLLIPLAWLMMLPPSWAVAQSLNGSCSGIRFVVLSALAFTAWNLFLDPQMVKWNLWIWKSNGFYFGIPLINFVGWFLASALITALVRPNIIPERPLLLVYFLTWIMETAGLIIFWDLHGPALCGFAAMGIFVFPAYHLILKKRQRIMPPNQEPISCLQ
jgi:uncharacterized membrane protein